MAGRPKQRIDYAGWSVDIFTNDTKIDKLLDAQGWAGFGVYFYICQMAFSGEGYFYTWCYDLCASTARKMGGGMCAGKVKETLGYCLQIGLFDKGLFDRWGVLTSRGIQRSYLIVLKSNNRRGTEIYREYWLLDKSGSDYRGVIFVSVNSEKLLVDGNLIVVNSDSLGENDHSLGLKESKVKESKEKESRVNKSKEDLKDIVASGDAAPPAKPPKQKYVPSAFDLQCVDKLIAALLKEFPNSNVPDSDAKKEAWAEHIDKMQRIDKRNQADIVKVLEFATADNFWKSNIRSTKKLREKFETLYLQSRGKQSKDGFNKFQQNDYDFEEIERKLLGEG